MLVGTFALLTVKELPAKDSFPPSLLVSVFDEESGSAITILAGKALATISWHFRPWRPSRCGCNGGPLISDSWAAKVRLTVSK
jgi:hypothetical protein